MIMKSPSQMLSRLALAFMVVAAVGCAAPSKQQTTGEYIDDSVITTHVKAAIWDDRTLRMNEIGVETFDGVVQLSGFVSSQTNIDRSISLARSIKGVKSVKNDMELK
jgi:osmotically-inducible protein OsmY